MTVVQQQPQPSPNGTTTASPSNSSAQSSASPSTIPQPQSAANPSSSTSSALAAFGGHGVATESASTSQNSGGSLKSQQPSKITQKPTTAVFSHPLSPNHSSGSDTDPVLTTATALRRLYFKSGRSCKPKGPTVPMVK